MILATCWRLLHWSNGAITSILFWYRINAATSTKLCFVHPSHAELMFWCFQKKNIGLKNRPQDMFENEVMGRKKHPRARWEAQNCWYTIFFSKWRAVLHVKTQCFLTLPDFIIFLVGKCFFSDPFHFSLAFKIYTFALLVFQSGNVLKKYGWGIGSEHRLWTFDVATMLEV